MDRFDPTHVDRLVRDLLGTDPARCGDAHTRLTAMGGFDHPDIRSALERIARQPSMVPAAALPPHEPAARLMAPREERTLGGYVLGELLGQGSFGDVHHVLETPDGAEPDRICLKRTHGRGGSGWPSAGRSGDASEPSAALHGVVLSTALVDRPGEFRCGSVGPEESGLVLLSEFNRLRELDSDLLPEVHAAGLEGETAWYAMERIASDDLRHHLTNNNAVKLDLRRLFRRLLRELEGLRQRRGDFFHGDLKPENVLVTPHRLRLVDPAFRGGPDAPLTSVLSIPYNPLGFSGEQADTCALAITLLEAFTGLQPFQRRTTVWRPSDGLDPAATLPLEVYAPYASRHPLVPRLMAFVAEPPSYVAFAGALERTV